MFLRNILKKRDEQKNRLVSMKKELKKDIEKWQSNGELYGIDFEVDDLETGKEAIRGLLRDNGYKGNQDEDFVVFGYQNGYSAGVAFRSDLNWPMIGLGVGEKINLQDTNNCSRTIHGFLW